MKGEGVETNALLQQLLEADERAFAHLRGADAAVGEALVERELRREP